MAPRRATLAVYAGAKDRRMASKQGATMPDNLSSTGSANGTTSEAERAALDARALAGEAIPPATLMTVLTSAPLPTGQALLRYAEQLMAYALESRDADASVLVTRLMD